MSIFKDQADFMSLGKQQVTPGNFEQRQLYTRLIKEEAHEFLFESATLAEEVKEATDVIVVAAGFLISVLGPDGAQQAWNAVHESNLTKVTGGVEHRADGKILKSPEYKAKAKAELMDKLAYLILATEEMV